MTASAGQLPCSGARKAIVRAETSGELDEVPGVSMIV